MTSIESGPTWSERLNPRNWTLAWKLAVVGLVPALLALSLGVLRVADQAGVASELGRSTLLLEVREQVAGAADTLRQERDEATLYVAGNRIGDRGVLEIGFGQTDGEIAEMLTAVRSATELEPTAAAVLGRPDIGASQLAALRKDVLDPPTPAVTVLDRYTQSIEALDVLDRALLRQLRTPGTAGLTDALTAIRSTQGLLAYQHTLLGSAIRATQLQPSDTSAVTSADAQITAQFRQYQLALTPEQLTRFGNFVDDPANAERQRLATSILATPAVRPITLGPSEWDAAYDGSRVAAERSGELIRQDLVASSTLAEEQASNLAGINSVILMLGLLLGITVALLVARSLIRSLRVLRTTALDVAERRLPQAVASMRAGETPDVTVDPVPLTSRDEVGQVARAFDAVHGQAVRLAADQAALQSNVSAMFVNLSRRSQALVERQLQLIEQLESNEQDADQLSNLFQLDHLATRMRRNSENLLVLAGTDLAKRNVAPIPMVDVLRAAVSEVEQYQRIVVQAPPTATIVGRAASDLVHLLAELLDNATNFSPPDSQVVMSTARTPDGSIVVEIADRGVGMIDHELSDANQRLGGPSTVDVSASRRMGLFVVGRLGARHGIGVQLSTTGAAGGGGLTASVTVPAYLVPSVQTVEARRPIGVPSAAGVPEQGPSAFGVPPQRAGMNGSNGRAGSLSALVAGTDGPANPAGVFDTPTTAGSGGPPFTAPPPPNGGPPGLPTRRPGSTLRPDRPSPSERPEPSDQSEADRVAAERAEARQAREVADQARLDQEAAEQADQDRAAQDGTAQDQSTQGRTAPEEAGSDAGPEPAVRGGAQNGTHPHGDPARPAAASANPASGEGNGSAPAGAAAAGTEPRPAASQEAASTGSGDGALPKRDRTPPASVPPSPPTTPMPLVRRGPTLGAPPSAAQPPAAQPPAGQRPGAQQPAVPLSKAQPPAAQPSTAQPSDAQPPAQRPAAQPSAAQSPAAKAPAADASAAQPAAAQPPATQPATDQSSATPAPPLPQRGALPPALPADRPAADPPSAPDELFAPSVPVSEPLTAPIGHRDSGNGHASGFDLGETTPIFAEIASAWFRSNRPVPVDWESAQPETVQPESAQPEAARPETARPEAARSEAGTVRPQPEVQRAPEPTPVQPAPVQPTRPAAPPVVPPPGAPVAEPAMAATSAAPSDREFTSAADEGWRAANGAEADRVDELTAAGLPKRRPRARLVPGSAGSAVLATPVSAARSAETIRGRLSSYQQGVRQGRESRLRGNTEAAAADSGTEPATAGGHHDEEST